MGKELSTAETCRAALREALGMYGEVALNLELWTDRKVAARQAVDRAQADLARVLQEDAPAAPRAPLAAVPDSSSP